MRLGPLLGGWLRRTHKRAPLRIVFVDPTFAYTAETPYVESLGGSQSAVCYLSAALAALGAEAILLTDTRDPGVYRGVRCIGLETTPDADLAKLNADVVVALHGAGHGYVYRQTFGPQARLVLWTQHAHDQPAVAALAEPEEREPYDAVMLVSEWQRERFIAEFGLERSRTHVIGNGVSPVFEEMFESRERIGEAKARPPVLAYTSTPFRGLDVLLDVFPVIRERVPGTRLKVFSDMRVYRIDRAQEQAEYGELYKRCRETAGVDYIGSVPQPELARELRRVSVLAYPNTFPETFCISAIEAMAAGCRVVTSDLGALRETTAGCAKLVPMAGNEEKYGDDFVDAVVSVLEQSVAGTDEKLLRAQVDYVNRSCTWMERARQWVEWLETFRNE